MNHHGSNQKMHDDSDDNDDNNNDDDDHCNQVSWKTTKHYLLPHAVDHTVYVMGHCIHTLATIRSKSLWICAQFTCCPFETRLQRRSNTWTVI